jgi:hypothetical protein
MFQKEIPILLLHVNAIPVENVTSAKYDKMMRGYKFLTYDCMIQSNLSVRHLHEMGCDIVQLLCSWGAPDTAENLIWTDTNKETIMAVYMALQLNKMSERFSKIDWFKIGMNIADMINLKLPVRVFHAFNISFDSLVEKKANEYGANWQNLFNWTDDEWKMLGFTEEAHQQYRNKIQNNFNVSETKRNTQLNFGPTHVQNAIGN